jgi:hypothetical protein
MVAGNCVKDGLPPRGAGEGSRLIDSSDSLCFLYVFLWWLYTPQKKD